jgi:hypothetical protein
VNSWLIKSSCITKDEHEARQLASAKVQQKNLLGAIQKIRVKIGGRGGVSNLTQNVTGGEGGV